MRIADVLAGLRDWCIETGDCVDILRALPDESVNCCVTSPPYWGLRDYGVEGQVGREPTLGEYLVCMTGVFREVRRTLTRDGTLWLNLGDSYAGTGHGIGGDGHRTAGSCGLKPKDLVGAPWRVAFALQADGWYLRSDIVWHKPNAMPESVCDRPTRAHEYIFLLSKSPRYYYDHGAVKEDAVVGDPHQPRGSVAVANHRLHAGRRKQDEVQKRQYAGFNGRYFSKPPRATRSRRSVWTVSTKAFSGQHFATYPPDLIEPCVLAGCPEGGVVLDPFSGSGTTGVVALRRGRRYIGIELNKRYAELSERRIISDAPLLNYPKEETK